MPGFIRGKAYEKTWGGSWRKPRDHSDCDASLSDPREKKGCKEGGEDHTIRSGACSLGKVQAMEEITGQRNTPSPGTALSLIGWERRRRRGLAAARVQFGARPLWRSSVKLLGGVCLGPPRGSSEARGDDFWFTESINITKGTSSSEGR